MLEIVFDNMTKPINVGVAVRLACATAAKLYFTGNSVDYRNRKALLAAVGYEDRASIIYEKDFEKLIKSFKNEGKLVVGAVPRAETVYSEIDYKGPVVFVFGSEATGLSREKLLLLDRQVTIPMPGKVESLNVVTAAAVLVYEALRQKGFYP